MKKIEIKQPEWLKHSNPGKTLNMYLRDGLPNSIAGWMLVVSLKHPLRAIYGSDLKAAWALLVWAMEGKLDAMWFELKYRLGLVKEDVEEGAEERNG